MPARLAVLAPTLLAVMLSVAAPAPAEDGALPAVPRPAAVWPVGAAAPGTAAWLGAAASVVRPFDPPPEPWRSGHRGVDLAAVPGTTVRAPMAGTVEVARTIVDRGVVVIRSGSVRVTLEPVRARVSPGTRVAAGEPVGALTGDRGHCAPSACLHWGVRVGAQYRDPLLLVIPHRPVLLPLHRAGG